MKLGLILLLLQFYSVKSEQTTLGLQDNVYCSVPRPSVVAVEPRNHNYFPYYVTLHRCEGSWHTLSPMNRRCRATKWEEIKAEVFSPFTGEMLNINLKNHTQCGYECVKNPSQCNMALEYWDQEQCVCGCKYPTPEGPPTPCEKGFRWSTIYCKCLCTAPPRLCPIRQRWNSDFCGCTCEDKVVKQCAREKKGLDHNTCVCVDVKASMRGSGGSVNARMYISLLVVQFCLIVILVFVLVHWVRKKRCPRVPSTGKYAKTTNRDSTDTLNFDSTGKKEDSDTGSIMIQTEGIEQPISEGYDTVDALNRETNL